MAKKFLAAVAATAALAFTATAASATTFTGSWTLAAHTSGSGLEVGYTPVATNNFSFNLSSSVQSQSIDLFNLFTNEGSVNWCTSWLCGGGGNDDIQAKPISLTFTFSEPTPNTVEGPIGGVTNGQITLFGLWQNGVLNWADDARYTNLGPLENPYNDPTTGGYTLLNFGPGTPAQQGQLSIRVNGGTFDGGVGGLGDDPLTVSALFHWDRDPLAVPEPATWALMISGFGMAGATLRRRRALAA